MIFNKKRFSLVWWEELETFMLILPFIVIASIWDCCERLYERFKGAN